MIESNPPHGFQLRAWGDLEGSGIWTFTGDGTWTLARYTWTVQANKPLLRMFSFLLKPLFAANHRWAMARGKAALIRELQRRSSQ